MTKYPDAQKRALKKYRDKQKFIQIPISPEEHEIIKQHAAKQQPKESMNQFVLRAIRNQIKKDDKK